MKDQGRIRRLFYRDGVSLSEISRKTGYSRNTVKRWLRTPEGTEPKYERQNPNVKIAPYAARLTKALETDARRPKRDRRTALKLFGELQAAGFTGTYCRVTEFIRRWRADGGAAVSKAFVPLHFELGEAFQFDWSEEHLVIGGVWRKILASHLKFCASRAFVVQAYPTQGHEMLFDAHTRSFAALGGIPRRGIYDNMKTAVDKVQKGKSRIVNARFSAMASHYLFDPDFCNVASGWEKGVVEKNVQDSRLRLWQDAGKERFSSFTELNVWLLERCRGLWQELRHPEYADLTVAEMLEHEQPSLMPMVAPFDGYVETLGKVSSTCLVTLDRNRYSVPCELVGQVVSLRLYPERIDMVAHDFRMASQARLLGSELLPLAQQIWRNERVGHQAAQGARNGKQALEEAAGRNDAGKRDRQGSPAKKVVSAPSRRDLVRYLIDNGLSERKSLRFVGMSPSSFRYRPATDRNAALKEQIVTLAQRHRRYGAGMIYLKLRQAGMMVNHKRVDRLYAEAGLQVRRRKRKKIPVSDRHPLERPSSANQVWSMDFVFDRTAEGRVIKSLTIVDDATHEAVAIVPERAIGGMQLTRVLDQLAKTRGLPKAIRTDNGKEFSRVRQLNA